MPAPSKHPYEAIRSEEYFNTAEEHFIFDIIVNKVLRIAIAQRTDNVLERRVVHTDFPTFITFMDTIIGRFQRSQCTEVTISNPCPPGADILLLSTLIVEFESIRFILIIVALDIKANIFEVTVRFRIRSIERHVLVETVVGTDRPDTDIIGVGILDVPVEVLIAGTARQLAAVIVGKANA